MIRSALLLASLTACSYPPASSGGNPITGKPTVSMEDALAAPLLKGALIVSPEEGEWRAPFQMRIYRPPSPAPGSIAMGCDGSTRPAPLLQEGVWNGQKAEYGPVPDVPYHVTFWTCALPITEPEVPDSCWIIVSHVPAERTSLTDIGLAGCWLLIGDGDLVEVPVEDGWQGMLRREMASNGRIDLRWTPHSTYIGRRVWMQLLVYRDGISDSGFQLSPGLMLQVGTPGHPPPP